MVQNKPGKAQFKVLFWRKWQTEGPAKTLGSLALAIAKTGTKALARAGKRAFDFRQPALPGLDPAPGQDLPALPPATILKNRKQERRPPSAWYLGGVERLLSRCTDWRRHPIWYWLSGGGMKGLLGARRFWAIAFRHFLDGIGRVGWTFRVAAILPLKFVFSRIQALREAAEKLSFDIETFRAALGQFRTSRTSAALELAAYRVCLHWCCRPPEEVLRRIRRSFVLPPLAGGILVALECLIFTKEGGWIFSGLLTLYGVLALLLGFAPWIIYHRILDLLPDPPEGFKKRPGSFVSPGMGSLSFAGFAIPSFVHSAPGSSASCILYSLFGSAAGQNTCSQSPLAAFASSSTVLQNIPQTLAIVAGLVSVLALFLLTIVYSYHIVQGMHTAAHSGDWTAEGVNAAWAPIRGSVSAALIAAPGGLSILASFILFVASTGDGLGDTAASKVANQLSAPSVAAVVPPGIQTVIDNSLYSLVCEHVLNNFTDPHGTVTAVMPQVNQYGGVSFSNVSGVGAYGPDVCGEYASPGAGMSQSNPGPGGGANLVPFLDLVAQGSPLDSIAAAIAQNANGCNSVVIGTGNSPCAPAGTPPNRQVFAQGGGLTNPAGGYKGGLTQITQNYVNGLIQVGATGPNGTFKSTPAALIQADGWASLGSYYRFFANEETTWAQIDQSLPQNIAPGGFANWSTVGSDEVQELQQAFRDTQNYIDSWGFAGTAAGQAYPFWAAVPQTESPAAQEQQKVALLSSVVDPTTGQTLSIPNYMSNLSSDPLSKLQNVIESADTALAVGWGAALAPAAIEGWSGGALGAYKGFKSTEGVRNTFLWPLSLVFLALTFVVGEYLPLVPMISIAFYLLFWIMEVAILALFAPLWALAVGIPQGEGFIGQHGREGLTRVTDIALRPLLLVGMFVLSLGLYEISANLLTVLTSEALGADKNIPSAGMWFTLAGLVGGYLVYTIVVWRAVHFSFELVHTGVYWAMRVLGIDGEKGREGREHEGFKEAGSWILQNVRTTLSGFKLNPKG